MPVGPAGSGSMAAWRSVSMQPALGRQPASPTLVVPVSQPHMPAPAMKLRRNSVAASDVGWAATQGMTVSEQAPLGTRHPLSAPLDGHLMVFWWC